MINRLMEKKRNGEEGFTLVEMLIVVIILGILAAVVVFGVSSFREDSVKSACNADLKATQTAVEAYKAKTGNYPSDTDAGGPRDQWTPLIEGNYLKGKSTATAYTVTLADGTGVVTANCPA